MITWEYVAGFFDGEGSIYRNKTSICLNMSNTNREVLEAIKEFIGVGSIHVGNRKDWKPQWKLVYTLNIYKQKDVERILIAMLPYLLIKQKTAQTVCSYFQEKREQLYKDDTQRRSFIKN